MSRVSFSVSMSIWTGLGLYARRDGSATAVRCVGERAHEYVFGIVIGEKAGQEIGE